MAALCEAVSIRLADMAQLLPDTPMAYALEPEEAETLKSVIEVARKAGQVKGSRMTWVHREDWFVFKNNPLGISVTMEDKRPEWAVVPPKAKLVPIYVPEALVAEMRLHLGLLVNG
jgi:hypothetical protein